MENLYHTCFKQMMGTWSYCYIIISFAVHNNMHVFMTVDIKVYVQTETDLSLRI